MRWVPFERAPYPPANLRLMREMAAAHGADIAELQREHEYARKHHVVFVNNLYQVNCGWVPATPHWPKMLHLSIKRRDKAVVGKERYRDFMRIKDELVGPEFEAVEVYPARSREVDSANQYHLWVLAEADARWPFGYEHGLRTEDQSGGCRQSPFQPHHRPAFAADHRGLLWSHLPAQEITHA